MNVTGGSADVSTYFVLRLAATGVEATGLTIANMDLQYTRSGVAPTAKVDATALAATDTAHTDNYGIEIDATDQPGLYRIDWPDAAFAAGVKEVLLTVKVATCFTEHMAVGIDSPTNPTKLNGTALTGRDIGASVLLSSGTGTGQLDFTSGVVKANLWQYIGTAFGGTAAQIVAAFQKFFDKAAPTGTINSLPDAVPGAAGGGFIAGTNAATSITTALTANITGNITGTLATVTALTNAPVDSTGVTEILTRLPDATAGAAGGLPTVAVGGVKLQQTADLTASQLIFKKNVARANFAFPMFDSTGALKTGLTVTAVIRKDAGASFAALAGSVTEIGVTGWYTVDWAQAETNADTIAFSASAAGANPTCYTILTQA